MSVTQRQTNPHDEAAELVRRTQRGDRSAFDELVRRYRQRIFALALHLSGDEAEADDITQEVFLRAYNAIDRFAGRSQFFTWVYRIAVNRSLNAKRDRKRRRESPLDDPRLEKALEADAMGSPARAAELRETYSRLLRALDRLPEAMRTTVVLVTMQGMSHEEVAVIQQCSPGTVAWRIHKARARLKRALERQPFRLRSGVKAAGRSQEISEDLSALLRRWSLPVPHPC